MTGLGPSSGFECSSCAWQVRRGRLGLPSDFDLAIEFYTRAIEFPAADEGNPAPAGLANAVAVSARRTRLLS